MRGTKIYQKLLLAAFGLSLCCTVSGCVARNVDEFYALPRHSDSYYELQKAIDSVMTEGVQYAAPVSGANQQSVQLADLDGDGEDEAIVFLRAPGEKPLRASVFDLVDGTYRSLGSIDGSGAAFESAEYIDLDGEGGKELILGYQISNQVLRSMRVYTLSSGQIVELMSANYSEYTLLDLDLSGSQDILLLRCDTEAGSGLAEVYCAQSGQLECTAQAPMSARAGEVQHILNGMIQPDVPASFVTSSTEEGTCITDVFAFYNGVFQNVAVTGSGSSRWVTSARHIYPADIDADGLTELPQLGSAGGETENAAVVSWYALAADGTPAYKLTTFHHFTGGWYLRLPQSWGRYLYVSDGEAAAGTTGLTFTRGSAAAKNAQSVMTLYAFTGDDRNTVGAADGRFIVAEKGGVTYSAALGDDAEAAGLTQETLRQMFNFIHIDWNSGER